MKLLSKKIIFSLIIILVLLLLTGGVFLWWVINQEVPIPSPKLISNQWLLKGESYEITIDDLGQKWVEHKEEGLKVKVPEDWIIEKYEDGIGFLSPDVEFDEYGGVSLESLKKGACGTGIEISKCEKVDPDIETYAEMIKNQIEYFKNNPQESKEFEALIIDNKSALKQVFRKEDGSVAGILIEVPIDNTIYSFSSGIIFSERCVEEFNKFLETISINK